MASKQISGDVKTPFEPLLDLFIRQAEQQVIGGAAFAVYLEGELVVDLWYGDANFETPWTKNTISNVFSVTKGIVSIAASQLIERGLLEPEKPVEKYWPAFGQNGKSQLTVAQVLQHRAGLSALKASVTREEGLDREFVISALAEQEPLWDGASAFGYHALTFGHLVSKLIEIVTGLTAGEYVQENFVKPLGLDLWIGLPESELANVARLFSDGNFKSSAPAPGSDAYWVERAMTFGGVFPIDPTEPGGFNDQDTLSAELAGANAVTNARSLAKLYSACVTETHGVQLLKPSSISRATESKSFGSNFWNEPPPYPAWGTGFMIANPPDFLTPGEDGFGHNGLGGQAGWASVSKRVGFGYTTNYLTNSEATQQNQQELVFALNKLLG